MKNCWKRLVMSGWVRKICRKRTLRRYSAARSRGSDPVANAEYTEYSINPINSLFPSSNSRLLLFYSNIPKSVNINSLISFEQNFAQFSIISKHGTEMILGLGAITLGVGLWKTHYRRLV